MDYSNTPIVTESLRGVTEASADDIRRGITAAQERLERALDSLEKDLAVHYERLHPFLGPEHPTEATTSADRAPGSPVANALHAYAEKIETLADGLRSITERIEN